MTKPKTPDYAKFKYTIQYLHGYDKIIFFHEVERFGADNVRRFLASLHVNADCGNVSEFAMFDQSNKLIQQRSKTS